MPLRRKQYRTDAHTLHASSLFYLGRMHITCSLPLSLVLNSKSQITSESRLLINIKITMTSLSLLSLPPLPKITNPNLYLSTLTTTNNKSNSFSCRLVLQSSNLKKIRGGGRSGVRYASASFSPQTLQWVSAISSAVLMLSKGTPIQKSFLVPLFALQAPATVISWIKGEYGTWSAFLALLVRLFYFIPGELDLPFLTMLIVIVAPYQVTSLRGSQAGSITSLAIAGYLAFQHFSRAGSLRRAFDQVSLIATLAIICITAVSCFFLF